MQYIAKVLPGLEDVGILEIKELVGASAKQVAEGRLKFKTDKIDILIYASRSVLLIYELVNHFKFKNLEDIKKNVSDFDINPPFAVRCNKDSNLSSSEIEKEVGEIIFKRGFKVNLSNPLTEVLVDLVKDECFIGKLLVKDLNKREYRIKINNQSIPATFAYALIRLAKWNSKEILIDPFCKDGVIPIEAALFASNVPRGFFSRLTKIKELDKQVKKNKLKVFGLDSLLSNVRSSEINSKLAEVRQIITWSKYDIEWLDTKFKEGEIDKVISAVPYPSKNVSESKVAKIYDNLFYHLKYVVSKKGLVIFVAPTLDLLKKHIIDFDTVEEREVAVGKFIYKLIILKHIV